ncbi:MAG: hypothetical protein QOI57_3142 [Rubrobacteraceae bacterium]|jgi:hypothetical protein|nr:hypothetical protein [Rubrobacteraceae bacterium]
MPLMEEESIRGNSQNSYSEPSAAEGWTNTAVAGKALGVSPRTVLSYIKKGLLEGKAEGEGVKRTWYVTIDSLNALRVQRLTEGNLAENFHESSAENVAEGIAEAMQNISARLAEESARAAEFRVRLELTERAESTLREALQRERERADSERERAERLERELVEARLSWWQRVFGR